MTLTTVLLAGGESRRMGKDKATIVFCGKPLWKRQLGLLQTLTPEKAFVSARTKPSWLPPDTEVLLDELPSRGPLSGLAKALERMQTSHLAVLAVDMPFMTSQQMQIVWDRAAMGCGVLPVIGDRAEPLAAIYPKEASPDVLVALSGDDFSLQQFSRGLVQRGKLHILQVSQTDVELYRSLNEPGDIKEGRFPNRPLEDVGGLESAAP